MACERCDDTGWKAEIADGVRRVVRCDCWRDRLARKFLEQAEIPSQYARCDFERFETNNDSLVVAVRKAERFAEQFPVVDRGLLFWGPSGLGKTHLSVAVLKRVLTRCAAKVMFRSAGKLLRQIRDTYNPVVRATEKQVIQPVMDAELLVLDDLGRERPTDWVEETLTLIIDTRYNERRPTIITTNYPVTDDASPDSLIARVGFRTLSRLHEMCDFIEMKGLDYRELGPHASPERIAELERKGSRSHAGLPSRTKGQARAQLKPGKELGWSGGKAGT